MTLKEAAKLFRSLRYYEQLSEGVEDKKARLLYLIHEYDIHNLGGYEIEAENGDIRYRKLPSQLYTQLRLELREHSID